MVFGVPLGTQSPCQFENSNPGKPLVPLGISGRDGEQMSDHADKLRQRASECAALAQKSILSEVRIGLLVMARHLYRMAEMHEAETARGAYSRPVATSRRKNEVQNLQNCGTT